MPKAMILAAGRGQRMGSLTAVTPKPLLNVKGQTLLENKILMLKSVGIDDIVINLAYLGEQIQQFAGDGSRWQVNIQYSVESTPLETGGGIYRALPLLGDKPFIVINADIYCDYPLQELMNYSLSPSAQGCLVLVNNPAQHAEGDFGLQDNGAVINPAASNSTFTFSGIGLYRPEMILSYPKRRDRFPLLELLQFHIARQQLYGIYYDGKWNDVGTPERLNVLNKE